MADGFRGGGFRGPRDRQIRSVILIYFVCVVFVAICGTVFIFFYADSSTAAPPPPVAVMAPVAPQVTAIPNVDVVVPVRMIETGETLQPNMFRVESRPQAAVSERIVRNLADIQGQFAKAVIMPGEPLNREYVVATRPINAITRNIPEGYRAVTITVNVQTGVEGWARPGARVDVAWTSGGARGSRLKIIVQNALVLSAERQMVPPPDAAGVAGPVPSTVTLLAAAKDAARILLASNTGGTLSLALRGESDHGKAVNFADVTEADLKGTSQDGLDESVQGFVRFSRPDGRPEEMMIINGQLVRKSSSGRKDTN